MNSPLAALPDLDATLVVRVQQEDEQAFTELYRRHARHIAGVAYRLMGSNADVEDIVQETFVDAAKGIRKIKHPEQFRRWLTRIAVRRSMRLLKRRAERTRLGPELAPSSAMATAPGDSDQADQARDALNRMPPKLRIPWVLNRLEGYSLSETAEISRASLATVKRRIADAESRLRRIFENG